MFGNITAGEVQLLNAYQLLGPNGQKELKDYTRYLLTKQYRREVLIAVFHNKLLSNLFHSLLFIVEKDDFDIEQVKKRVSQIKDLYYGIFEQVHVRYSEIIDDLDSNETVREFGRNSFDNLHRVLQQKDQSLIRMEIIDFYQGFTQMSKKKDARQIIAV